MSRSGPAAFAALVPDEPGWVDLGGMLRSGRCDVLHGADPRRGLVARSWDFPFAMAAGEPAPEVVRRAVSGVTGAGTAWAGEGSAGEWHLLAHDESLEAIRRALPGWRERGVVLHARPPESGRTETADAPGGARVRLAPDGWAAAGLDLDHLPRELRREYHTDHVRTCPLATALADGRPAAFCYAPYRTEAWWDVAVDTLPDHRRGGLATACFHTLAAHLAARGLRPVWGALADNRPSLRMAARLGFRPIARLTSFVAPDLPGD